VHVHPRREGQGSSPATAGCQTGGGSVECCGEVGLMTSGAEYPPTVPARQRRRVSLEEQARAKGTRPIGDGTFYAREELFAEPGELDEFLEYVRETRRVGTA
jgi:hypothetical protein